ncbi:MAG TPA: hypothetical protein VFQ61_02560, partial [Polyangiaceae bacterium]|nr:hypothetical protein [Polyangiaceae bacterium]
SDIAAFIDGRVNDALIESWLRAAVLIEGGHRPTVPEDCLLPPATYAVLAIVHRQRIGQEDLPRTGSLLTLASAGNARAATAAAIRRLNAAARPLPVSELFEPTARTRRIAAALAFPLSERQRRTLERLVLPEPAESQD